MSKRLIARVGLVKVYRDVEWSEFVAVGPDGSTCHDNDRESILGTAQSMARHYGIGVQLA